MVALRKKRETCSELVQEHIDWALKKQKATKSG
jgi:hypothetical protein